MGKWSCLFLFLLVVSVLSLPRPIFASSTYYLGMVERTYSDTGVYLTETLSVPSVGATIQKSKDIPSNTTTTTHLYSDALESTVLTIDSTGGIEKDIAYYPYGTFHSPSSPLLKTDIRYTGQRSDDSTDLYYYNARYYNPVTAHFISADKAEGPNRYSYVANNPIMRNDPSGHKLDSPPVLMDPTKSWSQLRINMNDSQYGSIYKSMIAKTKSYYDDSMKNDPSGNRGKIAVESVYRALVDTGYDDYTAIDDTRSFDAQGRLLEANKLQIHELTQQVNAKRGEVTRTRNLYERKALEKEGVELKHRLRMLYMSGTAIEIDQKIITEQNQKIELLDYMSSIGSECREQAFLAQFLMKEALGMQTDFYWTSHGEGHAHFFQTWQDPADGQKYQLDVLYGGYSLNTAGAGQAYFQPLQDYLDWTKQFTQFKMARITTGVR